MELKRLTLTHVRAFEQAEFVFRPGLNLLVGINGVGKSTVLDALRIMLSQDMLKLTVARGRPLGFSVDDIAIGQGALDAELRFEIAEVAFTHLIHQPRERYAADPERAGEVRGQAYAQPELNELRTESGKRPPPIRWLVHQPLAVYFSTRRSLPSMAAPRQQRSAGDRAAAFADALDHRELRIREFADWWLVQDALAAETANSLPRRHLAVLQEAVTRFLDGVTRLRAVRESATTLLLDKAGVTLDVRQLSDGERGVLALVLDLARRLTQANPGLTDPLREGRAVVLIDELDLHLHPRWQRTIAAKLAQTFPGCQLIATTHSPQIVGEVEPERIILLANGEPPMRPDQSLGMDSNWILRYLMGVDERQTETKQELARIADLIEDEQYDEATAAITTLHDTLGEFPELVRLQTRIDRIRLLGA
jgi:predicted ATP-binding protein involved in virulence